MAVQRGDFGFRDGGRRWLGGEGRRPTAQWQRLRRCGSCSRVRRRRQPGPRSCDGLAVRHPVDLPVQDGEQLVLEASQFRAEPRLGIFLVTRHRWRTETDRELLQAGASDRFREAGHFDLCREVAFVGTLDPLPQPDRQTGLLGDGRHRHAPAPVADETVHALEQCARQAAMGGELPHQHEQRYYREVVIREARIGDVLQR